MHESLNLCKEKKTVENSQKPMSLWVSHPDGTRPQVRAENVGHQAGSLGTSLAAHYRAEGHRKRESDGRRYTKDNQVTEREKTNSCKAAGC